VAALINVGVGRDFDTVQFLMREGHSRLRERIAALLPGGIECVGPGGAYCGRFDLGWVAPPQGAVIVASFAFLLARLLHRRAAPRDGLVNFLVLILGLVLANACLCGAISGPYARYQTRVEWLVPLGALLLVAQWAQSRPART
jgi:hypothetical protein